ncbi:hypothetical protein Nepgr_023147 [Nepenthes gracilis]|uniref:Uncharacterized protein n=1 Tax=Nepenthes gracilis TaxID=150966 RepID=A0AAD3T0Q6_NEPGR|nr:hypothetical protein Nepgr_023147 [Nepenthes gracilis]
MDGDRESVTIRPRALFGPKTPEAQAGPSSTETSDPIQGSWDLETGGFLSRVFCLPCSFRDTPDRFSRGRINPGSKEGGIVLTTF